MGDINRCERSGFKPSCLLIFVLCVILPVFRAQQFDQQSNQIDNNSNYSNNNPNNSNNSNNNTNNNGRQKRDLDPEIEDDLKDKSRPPILTQKEQEELNKQWHPPGHASPKSTSYAG